MVGRGTRLSPETGKDHLLLLDFLWHTERHELCRPAHLTAKNKEVADAITKRVEEAAEGTSIDLMEVEAVAEQDVINAREEALQKELTACRKKKGKLVDPLQFEMSICSADLSSYVPVFAWEMAPASNAQIKALEDAGIATCEIDNCGKASLLLNRLAKRRNEGLSTPKQIRQLEQRGFRRVGEWTKEEATNMISRIANNNWRTPAGVKPETYVPVSLGGLG